MAQTIWLPHIHIHERTNTLTTRKQIIDINFNKSKTLGPKCKRKDKQFPPISNSKFLCWFRMLLLLPLLLVFFFLGLATKLIHQNKNDKHACLLNQLDLGSSENRFVGCLVDDKKNSYTFVQTVHWNNLKAECFFTDTRKWAKKKLNEVIVIGSLSISFACLSVSITFQAVYTS